MDQILGNLSYCFVYIDDILVFSPDLTSHIQHLQDFLKLCGAHGLMIGLGKCEFAVPETEFLGHCLTSSGLHPLFKQTTSQSAISVSSWRVVNSPFSQTTSP